SFLVHPQQNVAIARNSPDGNGANKISKTIFVSNSSSVPISSTAGTASISNPTGIMYTTKFECDSIYADEGPLRPGQYDIDVSIFNKQKFKTTMLWNAIVNNGSASDRKST